ncbi:MAG: family 43 glycosylhydrolase [bacterium]
MSRKSQTIVLWGAAGLFLFLTPAWPAAGGEVWTAEQDAAYVQRFLSRFPEVQPQPGWESYAAPARFDEWFLREGWDQKLTGIRNDNGGIAWGWAYFMMALNEMYRCTGERHYWDANRQCVQAVLAARDDIRGVTLWTGKTAPAWSSDKYAERGRAVFAVHTGMIVYPILDFLLLARENPVPRNELGDADQAILRAARESLHYHDRQWREGPGEGEGHYIGMDQENALEGKPLPGNRLSSMGRALWLLWKLTGEEVYRHRAIAIGWYIKNRLTPAPDGAYYWPYWLPLEPARDFKPKEEIRGEDVSHASLTMALPILLAEENAVFTPEDMFRLGKTVTQGFARLNNGVLFGDITGNPGSNPDLVQIPGRWLRLSPFAPEVGDRLADFFLQYQPNPSPLDLALLIRFQAKLGKTIHVSKLGDGSDGTSWAKAFPTIQAALDAVPDGRGGHRIIIRPDTYMEANLTPPYKGAKGNYNQLTVDFDGKMGSGSTGYAVLDCGDPQKGFQSVDWWSNFKANPEFSGAAWDRWKIQHVYATGGDAGLFWDLPPKLEPFTIVVEDSVGIGRAFGGGAANFIARPDEPVVFRRCHLWSLDWWGDAGGAYVRAENKSKPDYPDVTFEDCVLVGPDNALQAGNPGFQGYTRVKLKGCRLIALNFSQPRGTPSTGIIHSKIEGQLLHADLEDCLLMGYKVFGAGQGEVSYSTSPPVEAYVQFEQEVPPGIHRLGDWPVQAFADLAPPPPVVSSKLSKENRIINDYCELSPMEWRGTLCLLECIRPASGGEQGEYYLRIRETDTGKILARFGEGYSLACAFVQDGTLYVYASRWGEGNSWNDVNLLMSPDLQNWQSRVVIQQENEHLFNSSVCATDQGYVMAYESDDPQYTPFSVKFAVSQDLVNWTKVPDAVFLKDRYAACPCIRYAGGYYYILYLEHRAPRWHFETYLARSKDLKEWEWSAANPVLRPDWNESINASDPDIIEYQGKTYLYYCISDQMTWAKIKRAVYPGPLREFLEGYFPK